MSWHCRFKKFQLRPAEKRPPAGDRSNCQLEVGFRTIKRLQGQNCAPVTEPVISLHTRTTVLYIVYSIILVWTEEEVTLSLPWDYNSASITLYSTL